MGNLEFGIGEDPRAIAQRCAKSGGGTCPFRFTAALFFLKRMMAGTNMTPKMDYFAIPAENFVSNSMSAHMPHLNKCARA